MRASKKQLVKESFTDGKFYLLAFWSCVSLSAVCFLRIASTSDRLYYNSLEQVFAWFAVVNGFLLLAVYLLPAAPKKSALLKFLTKDSSTLGWITLWFAALHATLVLTNQLGGWQGFWLLSVNYQLIFGLSFWSLFFLLRALVSKKPMKYLSLATLVVLISLCLLDASLRPNTKKQSTPANVSGSSIHAH